MSFLLPGQRGHGQAEKPVCVVARRDVRHGLDVPGQSAQSFPVDGIVHVVAAPFPGKKSGFFQDSDMLGYRAFTDAEAARQCGDAEIVFEQQPDETAAGFVGQSAIEGALSMLFLCRRRRCVPFFSPEKGRPVRE